MVNGEVFGKVQVALAVLIHVNILIITAWDLVAAASGHTEYTVSSLVQGWGRAAPVIPLAIGILMGHLFWPVR